MYTFFTSSRLVTQSTNHIFLELISLTALGEEYEPYGFSLRNFLRLVTISYFEILSLVLCSKIPAIYTLFFTHG
jgi:hypothetical protein